LPGTPRREFKVRAERGTRACGNTGRAKSNDLIDKAEGGEKMIKQVILDMRINCVR
jgi:hypothetical protein